MSRRKRPCGFCSGIQSGSHFKCPFCNRKLIHCLPTLDQIHEEAAAIRTTWPRSKLRQQEHWRHVEIPKANRVSDGMIRRETWDGGI